MPADPVSSSIFAGINTAFKLAEFGLSLYDASEEVQVFCRLIRRVRDDRAEANREQREKADYLNATPLKKQWIEQIMTDVDKALVTIGALVEAGRADTSDGRGMSLQHRFEWVLSRKQNFLTKQSLLSTCHQSLCTAIVYMQNLPGAASPPGPSPPSYWSGVELEDNVLRAPSARRPKPKPEYKIPESPTLSTIAKFSDDWEQRFAAPPPQCQGEDQPSEEKTLDNATNDEMLEAAAAALREAGGRRHLAITIAETLPYGSTPPPSINGRRLRNEARFCGR